MSVHSALRADPCAIVLAAVLEEVRATASEAQARGFLLAVGRRLAAAFPLTGIVELDALEEGMATILQRLGAGTVRLMVDADGIGIEHAAGAPEGIAPDILEGLYAGWFATLGNDRLALTRRASAPGRLSFHYGR
ncbi:MAG: hypothetical protein ABW173_12610 [Sphingomonas sp.]